jgi:hypothetical protein
VGHHGGFGRIAGEVGRLGRSTPQLRNVGQLRSPKAATRIGRPSERSWLASFFRPSDDPGNPFPRSLKMDDELEPERRTIHVFDIDLESGEVPVRELHVVATPTPRSGRGSILSMDLGPALRKLEERSKPAQP